MRISAIMLSELKPMHGSVNRPAKPLVGPVSKPRRVVLIIGLALLTVAILFLPRNVAFVPPPPIQATPAPEHRLVVVEPSGSATKPDVDHKPADSGDGMTTLNALLATGDFDAAVELYDAAYAQLSIEQSAPLRDRIIEFAAALDQRGEPERAQHLIESYLSIYYADAEALVLSARIHRNARAPRRALHALTQAIHAEHRPSVAAMIRAHQQVLLGTHVQQLLEAQRIEEVTTLYEWLTLQQPQVAGFHMALARAYLRERREREARQALAYIRHDIEFGERARQMMRSMGRSAGNS